jgi:hypothetical protein
LPAGWTSENGALNLGEVFDTFTLTVNGQAVSIDQLAAAADIGPYLKAGRNSITVRVATTLNNRLAKIDERVANRGLVQPYGMVGSVVLTPYSQPTVWKSGQRKSPRRELRGVQIHRPRLFSSCRRARRQPMGGVPPRQAAKRLRRRKRRYGAGLIGSLGECGA